jgi:hypothetical protein
MNRRFAERQEQVLSILELLAKVAARRKETLVFIGGSAVQVMALKKARRLSVDLDVYYSGNAGDLLASLGKDYQVTKRQAKQADMFDFYNAVRGSVQVKIDVARFRLAQRGEPYETRPLGAGKTGVKVATPAYLLAAKLSALAVGTVGRREFAPIDFLKDVFDANALIDEYGVAQETVGYFRQVCGIQNRINKTTFAKRRIIESMVRRLFESALTDDGKATIKKSDLGNFNEYSLQGMIKKTDYWVMAYRLAAYSNALLLGERMPEIVKEIEKGANEKYSGREFAAMCEQKLAEKGIGKAQLHELKVLAPKALVYLYYAHYPPGGNPITSEE